MVNKNSNEVNIIIKYISVQILCSAALTALGELAGKILSASAQLWVLSDSSTFGTQPNSSMSLLSLTNRNQRRGGTYHSNAVNVGKGKPNPGCHSQTGLFMI